jgi:hypothetical protein
LEDLVNEVGVYGPIESFRIDYERHEAYVSFVDGAHAATLLDEKPTISFARSLPGQPPAELTWGKKKALAPEIADAVKQGATRNLYIGNLPASIAESQDALTKRFLPFGAIESVRVMRVQG